MIQIRFKECFSATGGGTSSRRNYRRQTMGANFSHMAAATWSLAAALQR
jgi:hypothetical protein